MRHCWYADCDAVMRFNMPLWFTRHSHLFRRGWRFSLHFLLSRFYAVYWVSFAASPSAFTEILHCLHRSHKLWSFVLIASAIRMQDTYCSAQGPIFILFDAIVDQAVLLLLYLASFRYANCHIISLQPYFFHISFRYFAALYLAIHKRRIFTTGKRKVSMLFTMHDLIYFCALTRFTLRSYISRPRAQSLYFWIATYCAMMPASPAYYLLRW